MKKIIFTLLFLVLIAGCKENSAIVESVRLININSPVNEETSIDIKGVNLSWACEGMTSPNFTVYLGEKSDSMTSIADNILNSEYKLTTILKYSTTYYWKVVGVDEKGKVETTVSKFTTAAEGETLSAIPKAVLVYPGNNENDINSISDIIMKWNYSTAVSGYTFEVHIGETRDNLSKIDSVTGKKQYTLSRFGLQSNKKYYWKIITKDTKGNEATSEIYSFNTIKLSTDYSLITTMLKTANSSVVSVEQEVYDSRLSKIYGADSSVIGYYTATTPYGDDIKGYAGACPVLIVTDKDMKIKSVELMTKLGIYKETSSYVQRVIDAGFFNKWNGRGIKEAATLNVDTIAGSTLTSRAVLNNVKRRAALIK